MSFQGAKRVTRQNVINYQGFDFLTLVIRGMIFDCFKLFEKYAVDIIGN